VDSINANNSKMDAGRERSSLINQEAAEVYRTAGERLAPGGEKGKIENNRKTKTKRSHRFQPRSK
jgi:hypothetical protein